MLKQLVACVFVSLVVQTSINGDTSHAYRAESQHQRAGNGDRTAADREPSEVVEGECTEYDGEGSCLKMDRLTQWEWDPKGYILFCPCMGRLGNQAEHYLGALAFAKALDRTLVLPPFRTFTHASFGLFFEVDPMHEFHRVILMEDFMEYLAPDHWPPGQRSGYCHLPVVSEMECNMKIGNPFGKFWDHFNIDFVNCIKYQLHNSADITDETSMERTKKIWDARFPAKDHPVIALRGSPGSYPMLPGNRAIQGYWRWRPEFFSEAGDYIERTFKGERYVGIHLRNGMDWVKACEHAEGARRYMASPQCHDPGTPVTKELCLPSLPNVLQLTLEVFEKVSAKHLYIATDKHPHVEDFEGVLNPIGVSVHYQRPERAETDLMILGQADFFIGNCVSSFTSFVKRERDASGKPSVFWSQELKV